MGEEAHNMVSTGTQAIERGLTLLELVAHGTTSIREMSERTQLPRSTVTRLLGALERFSYLARADDGSYRLGTGVLALATQWQHHFGVERAARQHLEALVHEVYETGHVTIREGRDSVCVAFSDSPQSIRLTMAIGNRVPLHVGAHAKTLLAYAPEAVQASILSGELSRFTPRSIVDSAALEEELDQIRLRGYAESYGEIDAGAYALAAPIRGFDGAVFAAIGVSGPTERMLEIPKEKLTDEVLAAARAISGELGFREPAGAGG
jgi:IclR family transcriptional regulator, KDG regulon repressor